MSRIGKKPINIPAGVTVLRDGRKLSIAGPKGALSFTMRPEVDMVFSGSTLTVIPVKRSRETAAMWGLSRALVASMIEGVDKGFEKRLEIEGIGYRAALDGRNLQLLVGFSHPVKVEAPEGITFKVDKNTITVFGADKELVGNVAARVRKIRPPEPYKGKGIHYVGEKIRRKSGKKAVGSGG